MPRIVRLRGAAAFIWALQLLLGCQSRLSGQVQCWDKALPAHICGEKGAVQCARGEEWLLASSVWVISEPGLQGAMLCFLAPSLTCLSEYCPQQLGNRGIFNYYT